VIASSDVLAEREVGLRGSKGARAALLAVALAAASIGLSSAAAVSPRQLVEVADLSDPVVSPDGSLVAFRLVRASVDRNTYESVWYVQPIDGSAPPQRVGDGGLPLRSSAGSLLQSMPVWAPDGRWIYFRAFADGRVDVWRAAVDGSRAEPVTDDPADVLAFLLGSDGKTLRYRVGATRDAVRQAEQNEYENGIRIDATVPLGQALHQSGLVDGRPATQRLGHWADRVPLLADVPERWKAVDLATARTRDIPEPGQADTSDVLAGRSRPSATAREPGGGRLAALTPAGAEIGVRRQPYAELTVHSAGGSAELLRCSHALCRDRSITSVQWRPGSDDVIATATDPSRGLAQSIFLWNARSNAARSVVVSDGLLNGGRSEASPCGVSADALVCVAAEADGPPRLERIDLESGARTVLFEPNAALAMEFAAHTPARPLTWTDADGNAFTGQLFAARGGGPLPPPLFVNYFRCAGFVRGGYGDEWPMAALAARGISALCINAAATRVDAIERYELGQSAVESAIELLAARGEIDPSRVGMGGLSFGTEVTMWTAMHSDALAAISVTSPLLSPNYYLLGSLRREAFFSGLREVWQAGAPGETPERWQAISPMFNLDAIKAPILMQVPEQEYIKTLDYAIPLIRDRRAELHVFPEAPHIKFQPRHLLAAQRRNLDWFAFWLQDFEDPDPAKALQYSHWRDMQGRVGDGR